MIGFFQRDNVQGVDILRDILLVVDNDHVFPNEDEIRMRYGKFPSVAQMQNEGPKWPMHLLADHLEIQHKK